MKQFVLILFVFCTYLSAVAQEKFEFAVNAKMGYYFLDNKMNDLYYPENEFSPGVGVALKYLFWEKTNIALGMNANYLKPDMIDFDREPLDLRWSSFNLPLEIQQGIGKTLFLSAGVTMIRQLKGYRKDQKIPEYNWQTGIGWKFKGFNLSLFYTRGFKEMEKMIEISSTSWFSNDVRHQEIYLKVEYPLWKF